MPRQVAGLEVPDDFFLEEEEPEGWEILKAIQEQALEGISLVDTARNLPHPLVPPLGHPLSVLGAGLIATSPLAPGFRLLENIGRGVIGGDLSRVGNLVENRPSTGSKVGDFIVDLVAGFVPAEAVAFTLARRLAALGKTATKKKIIETVREVAPEAEEPLGKLLETFSDDDFRRRGIRALLPGDVEEVPLPGGLLKRSTRRFEGEPGGLEPPREVTITGQSVEELERRFGRRSPFVEIEGKPAVQPSLQQILAREAMRRDVQVTFTDKQRILIDGVDRGKFSIRKKGFFEAQVRGIDEPVRGDSLEQLEIRIRDDFIRSLPGGLIPDPFITVPRRVLRGPEKVASELVEESKTPLAITGFRTFAKLKKEAEEITAAHVPMAPERKAEVLAKSQEKIQELKNVPPAPEPPMSLPGAKARAVRLAAERAGLDPEGQAQFFGQVLRFVRPGATFPRTEQEADLVLKALGQPGGPVDPEVAAYGQRTGSAIWRQFVQSVRTTLRKGNAADRQLIRLMDDADNDGMLRGGDLVARTKNLLGGLSKGQRRQIGSAMFKQDLSGLSPELRQKAEQLRQWSFEIAEEMEALGVLVRHKGGEKIPFKANPAEIYFPRHVQFDKLLGSAPRRVEEFLISTRQAADPEEARALIKSYFGFHRRHRDSNLEFGRELTLPEEFYELDALDAFARYFAGATRRLEQIKRFGPQDEIANQLIQQSSNRPFADSAYRMYIGEPQHGGVDLEDVSSAVRSASTVVLMTLSPFINLTQSSVTALRTNSLATAKALVKTLVMARKESQEFALRAGATLDSEMARLMRVSGNVGAEFLKFIGFTATERFNRTVAAVAGREYAKDIALKFSRNPRNRFLARELERLGMDPSEVLRRGGQLSDRELRRAAIQVVRDSQFRTDVQDLPMFWSHPIGKMLTQFKSFIFNQAKLLKEEIFKQAVRATRDPSEAKRFLENVVKVATIFPAAGFAFGQTRGAVRNFINQQILEAVTDIAGANSHLFVEEIDATGVDDRMVDAIREIARAAGQQISLDNAEKLALYLDSAAAAGALALYYDVWQAAQWGDRGWLSFFFGPSPRLGFDILSSLTRAVQGDGALEEVGRVLRRVIPILNPFLVGPKPKGNRPVFDILRPDVETREEIPVLLRQQLEKRRQR